MENKINIERETNTQIKLPKPGAEGLVGKLLVNLSLVSSKIIFSCYRFPPAIFNYSKTLGSMNLLNFSFVFLATHMGKMTTW